MHVAQSNIARFIPSVAGYAYAVKDNDLFVNLFMSNIVNTEVDNGQVQLTTNTNYPWEGNVAITVDKAPKKGFNLRLRIPGWVRNEVVPSDLYSYADGINLGYKVMLNGEELSAELVDGYFNIDRQWQAGDKIELIMDMAPRIVKANPQVKDDEGRIAIEKGPIVYCAEWPDNPEVKVREVVLNENPKLVVTTKKDKLYGIDEIYIEDSNIALIPYYAWNHRGPGDMIVWMKQQ